LANVKEKKKGGKNRTKVAKPALRGGRDRDGLGSKCAEQCQGHSKGGKTKYDDA